MQSLFQENKKGKLFIVSAPAGTGKTTLVTKLIKEFPSIIRLITTTTREPRKNEKAGVDYEFISKQKFEKNIEENEFLEHVELYGNYYGSSKFTVEKLLKQKKHVILVIDTEGARKIREKGLHAVFIMILPPSFSDLEKRLKKRETESKETLRKRLTWAKEEMKRAKEYDYCFVNDDLKTAYTILKSIFIAEEHHQ